MIPPNSPPTTTAVKASRYAPRDGIVGGASRPIGSATGSATGSAVGSPSPALTSSASMSLGTRRIVGRRVRCLTMREWLVAGALVEAPHGLLLVRNERRGG